jgi:hypothetical protein
LPEKEEGNLPLVIGDAMVEVLKEEDVRKMQFEDFLLDINPSDVISEQEKEGLKQFAMSLAQNGAMTISEYIKLLQINNKSQMYNFFTAVEKRKEIIAQQQQQAQMEQQMAQAQMAQQTQLEQADIQAQAGLDKEAMKQGMI